jgi:hypothetical protein
VLAAGGTLQALLQPELVNASDVLAVRAHVAERLVAVHARDGL